MTVGGLHHLDAHEQPSDQLRAEWKAFSRADHVPPSSIDDPRLPLEQNGFRECGSIPQSRIADAFSSLNPDLAAEAAHDCPIIHHPLLPGLLVIPNLVPPAVQTALLNTTLHGALSNPIHQTNLHVHYSLPYPSSSFFSLHPDSPPTFLPKDPAVHRPLSVRQVLQRRLHWVTLGGQYDWTNRVYPAGQAPEFPTDLSGFLGGLFPATLAQAAIVNFYSPGDTMMMHRDVSEEAERGLVSLSLGCDCLFMIAPNEPHRQQDIHDTQHQEAKEVRDVKEDKEDKGEGKEKKHLLLRLRSGDAVYMTQESRYAWHGVPKVFKDTCPEYLADWPAVGGDEAEFEAWRGWMRNKRINLNVRQMTD